MFSKYESMAEFSANASDSRWMMFLLPDSVLLVSGLCGVISNYLRRRRRLCFWFGLFVCLSVCLSVRQITRRLLITLLLANLWTDFDEIFCRGRAWLKDQVIRFWWRSGSRFGSWSPKSEIRILRITQKIANRFVSCRVLRRFVLSECF